ncbi:MAG: hypothetical protein M3527_01225 [Actinomycetota bacterium]|nr:hypothetical protein [Acidimicrobiia bacterium]MDQ3293062.1 hypothetical protein [Actinomycetota bacterium]
MHNRRSHLVALDTLPGLSAEIAVEGYPPVKGTLVDVGDGMVVIAVRSATQAAVLSAASTARLTVDAPAGVRFVTTASPVGTAEDRSISLAVGAATKVTRRTA